MTSSKLTTACNRNATACSTVKLQRCSNSSCERVAPSVNTPIFANIRPTFTHIGIADHGASEVFSIASAVSVVVPRVFYLRLRMPSIPFPFPHLHHDGRSIRSRCRTSCKLHPKKACGRLSFAPRSQLQSIRRTANALVSSFR
jgi:hypothetical protein